MYACIVEWREKCFQFEMPSQIKKKVKVVKDGEPRVMIVPFELWGNYSAGRTKKSEELETMLFCVDGYGEKNRIYVSLKN